MSFFLNLIGRRYVCSLVKLKIPIFKANWPIKKKLFCSFYRGRAPYTVTVLFWWLDSKNHKNKPIGLVLRAWGYQSADIEDSYALPKLQMEALLSFFFEIQTNLYQTAESNIAANGYIQQWPLYIKCVSTYATRKYIDIFFSREKYLREKTVDKIKTYCMAKINFLYVLSFFKNN